MYQQAALDIITFGTKVNCNISNQIVLLTISHLEHGSIVTLEIFLKHL